ncbi:MAG: aminotransferase class III-fold pyridoxal phosphate-dependent enzyme [Chloroflexi bacterium]|nr:aminotransferase class III-fold pyridoxal phosphate-dependent enzyme [Chloroflexota bacterium]
MTNKSAQLQSKAQKYLAGGSFGNPTGDLVIARGTGSHVWDSNGREYVDYLLGSGPMLLGHAHPAVIEAVQDQLANGTTYFAMNEKAILLAEEIVRAVPSVEKIRFMSTGTEATAYALRLARAATGREKILKFEGGYHGMHDYALMSLRPSKLADYPNPVPDSRGIPRAVEDTVLVAPFNDLEYATSIIEDYRDELAAVIVEPLQRIIPPAPGFLEGLREATQIHDVPLIFDEVVTGFRLAFGGAQEYYGVEPDITTLGKVIGGGFPLAAVGGKAQFMDEFDAKKTDEALIQIGTLNGNPIAAAAGLASINVLKQPGTYERLRAISNSISSALESAAADLGIAANLVGDGPVFDLVFTGNPVENYAHVLQSNRVHQANFLRELKARGVLKDSKFYVSIVHNTDDVAKTVEVFTEALAATVGT